MKNKEILLMVSGSIAAYKSTEILRELSKKGAKVSVVLSESAKKFVTPLTMQTLSGRKVFTDMFSEDAKGYIEHIELADKADLVLVAPASANLIARARIGLADDLLTSVLLVTRAPVLIAPAMNVNMWKNPITQENVETLKKVGMKFIDPEEGELACGWVGEGRLASLEKIVQEVGKNL